MDVGFNNKLKSSKLSNYVNVTENKRTKQLSFNLQKNKLKRDNVRPSDLLNISVPLKKKLEDFENF